MGLFPFDTLLKIICPGKVGPDEPFGESFARSGNQEAACCARGQELK